MLMPMVIILLKDLNNVIIKGQRDKSVCLSRSMMNVPWSYKDSGFIGLVQNRFRCCLKLSLITVSE